MRLADLDFDVYKYGAYDLVVICEREVRIVRSVTGLETVETLVICWGWITAELLEITLFGEAGISFFGCGC